MISEPKSDTMNSSKSNRMVVLSYINKKTRISLSELEEHFATSQGTSSESKGIMSKGALYRGLKALEERGEIIRQEKPVGTKGKRVYFEVPLVDTIAMVRRFIQTYKNANETNPTIEEIAIAVKKTPEEVKPAVYAVASDLEWEPPNEQGLTVESPFGITNYTKNTKVKKSNSNISIQALNKEEVELIFENLSNSKTEEAAANYLMIISSRQQVLKYPHFLKHLTEAIHNVKNEQATQDLISSIYYLISSLSFEDMLEQKTFSKEFELLLDELYQIVCSEKTPENIRCEALRPLGMRTDKRIIPYLVESLKKAKNFNEYPLRGVFDSWLFNEFYKKYKTKLAEEVFNIAKENKEGAKILIQLINRDWRW